MGRPADGIKYGGRKPGSPNKLTGDVKAMILAALDVVGGRDYLVLQARKNPVAFLALLGKLLPTQLTGKDGGAIVLDPGSLTDAELAARIDSLQRIALMEGAREAEEVPE